MNKQRLIDFSFSHCPFYSVVFSNGSSTSGDITQIYWTSTKGADKPGGFIVLSFLLGVDLGDNDRGKIWIGLKRRHPLAIVSFHSCGLGLAALSFFYCRTECQWFAQWTSQKVTTYLPALLVNLVLSIHRFCPEYDRLCSRKEATTPHTWLVRSVSSLNPHTKASFILRLRTKLHTSISNNITHMLSWRILHVGMDFKQDNH